MCDLERFADARNMPRNLPTICHLDQIAEASRMFLLSPCVLPVLRYHLAWNGEVLRYNDSMIDLHRLCLIPTSFQYN